MLPENIPAEVGRTSAFWQEYRQRLAHLQSHWRGREQDYLDLVKVRVAIKIEAYRGFLLKHTGVDINTGQQAAPAPQSQYTSWQKNFLVNAERAALDWINIDQAVVRAIQIAKDNGKDPVLTGYDMFFWAMENVPAAGTVFLMQDTEAIAGLEEEQEGAALLLSGWADAHLSLQGNRAARLLQALKSEGKGNQEGQGSSEGGSLRQRLREELPGAVMEAVEEWKPGQELFCPDKPLVAPGKESAGRKPRTFRSRVARSIERLGADRPHAQLHEDKMREDQMQEDQMQEDQMQEDQVSGTAAKTSASSVPVSPASRQASETWAASSEFRKLWKAWATAAKLGPHEQQIADYLCANPDCLVPESLQTNGRLKTRRGTWTDIAQELGRSALQVRQEGLRMARKMKRVRAATR